MKVGAFHCKRKCEGHSSVRGLSTEKGIVMMKRVMARPFVILVVLVWAAAVAVADLNNYGVVADNLQNNAYSRFLSADGQYFNQNNGGNAKNSDISAPLTNDRTLQIFHPPSTRAIWTAKTARIGIMNAPAQPAITAPHLILP